MVLTYHRYKTLCQHAQDNGLAHDKKYCPTQMERQQSRLGTETAHPTLTQAPLMLAAAQIHGHQGQVSRAVSPHNLGFESALPTHPPAPDDRTGLGLSGKPFAYNQNTSVTPASGENTPARSFRSLLQGAKNAISRIIPPRFTA